MSCESEEKDIDILVYNIAGFKNKVNDGIFISFVKQYKIFVLTETHLISDENQYIENIFYDYKLCWTPAEKNSKFGRASGGIVCGIHLNSGLIEMIKFENYHDLLILNMEICKQKINFVPLYLNGGRWDEDFNWLRQYVELNISF